MNFKGSKTIFLLICSKLGYLSYFL